MHQVTILVVDDDPSINELVQDCLEEEGWKTFCAYNGDDALRIVRENNIDLVLLDIMMPGTDGIEVCRQIAAISPVPVIMLSAKGDLDDKLTSLKLGADDYITKPFHPQELIARVKVALRRREEKPISSLSSFSSGDLEINFSAKRVRIKGNEVKLTPTEYRLLEELTHDEGKALTYEYLLQKIWGPEYSEERQYLHIHIGRLRTKIEPDPKHPVYIITVPGIGYRFQDVRKE